ALFVDFEYFRTMGMPLILGRSFTPEDKGKAPNVAVINETMSRRLFGDVKPVGRHINWGPGSQMEIVGLVRDSKYNSVLAPARPTIYTPLAQFTSPGGVR